MGTGLPGIILILILAASVVFFLYWGGPLWESSREETHTARIVFSYLLIVPLSAVALAAYRNLGWTHLVATVGLAWAAKLLVTSTVFWVVAPGTASRYEPRAVVIPNAARRAKSESYSPAAGEFARGRVEGRVFHHGSPAAGVVVFVERPRPGLPRASRSSVAIHIEETGYDRSTYLAHAGDTIELSAAGASLHTVVVHKNGSSVANRPLPPGGHVATFVLRDPGKYRLTCGSHPHERAGLVVVDHPYATLTGADGRFALADVPAGDLTLTASADGARFVSVEAYVEAGETAALDIALGETSALAPSPSEPTRIAKR